MRVAYEKGELGEFQSLLSLLRNGGRGPYLIHLLY